MPPPPAPSPSAVSFQTVFAGDGPSVLRCVPPTKVTNGSAPWSSVASAVLPFSRSHPSEPDPGRIVVGGVVHRDVGQRGSGGRRRDGGAGRVGRARPRLSRHSPTPPGAGVEKLG